MVFTLSKTNQRLRDLSGTATVIKGGVSLNAVSVGIRRMVCMRISRRWSMSGGIFYCFLYIIGEQEVDAIHDRHWQTWRYSRVCIFVLNRKWHIL